MGWSVTRKSSDGNEKGQGGKRKLRADETLLCVCTTPGTTAY